MRILSQELFWELVLVMQRLYDRHAADTNPVFVLNLAQELGRYILGPNTQMMNNDSGDGCEFYTSVTHRASQKCADLPCGMLVPKGKTFGFKPSYFIYNKYSSQAAVMVLGSCGRIPLSPLFREVCDSHFGPLVKSLCSKAAYDILGAPARTST